MTNEKITIVTGNIDSGKTTFILTLYNELKRGSGFVSKKRFVGEGKNLDFTGYDLMNLNTGESVPLAYKAGFIPPVWDEVCRRGPYSFSRKGFKFGEEIIERFCDEIGEGCKIEIEKEPVFIDEIGPLELNGLGFSQALRKILRSRKTLYIVVRSQILDDVIREFDIVSPQILVVPSVL